MIKTKILEEMYKKHKKVKDKGNEKTTASHFPGNPLVDGGSSYRFIIVSRVMLNTEYKQKFRSAT